jgi:hypothetical protein
VEFGDEGAERFHRDFEPWAEEKVVIAEAYKRAESLAGGWEVPVIDLVEFGLSWTVAISGDIVPNILKAALKEITFRKLKRDSVSSKDFANAVQVLE